MEDWDEIFRQCGTERPQPGWGPAEWMEYTRALEVAIAADVKVRGLDAVIENLAAMAIIQARAALAIQKVLALMARRDEGGG